MGYSLWNRKELDTTEQLRTAQGDLFSARLSPVCGMAPRPSDSDEDQGHTLGSPEPPACRLQTSQQSSASIITRANSS